MALNGQVNHHHFSSGARKEHQDWAAAHRIKSLVNNVRAAAITGRVAM
eukprot:CAMPEP_0181321626 /NCGR_PEP_ID=MMETSP1101-20121128/18792_1 /TAXON_ID=46948 /ORGANISM="Rhodomonas abbreviata, Strain Caron Lab Isolate" /LENGTH=47 /DNA_ID= /DNA_START= /DNA_END= /DNA_ORIENTATION=